MVSREVSKNMPPRVYVIGFGMGDPALLTDAGRRAIGRSDLVIGSPRLLEALQPLLGARATCLALVRSQEIAEALRATDAAIASVVMSGDVGFYSGATGLYDLLSDFEVKVIPGVSTLSYLCARLKMPWQDAHLVSVHGRTQDVVGAVQSHAKTFVLTGGSQTASDLCARLVERGLGDVTVHVGERLSYPDERIVTGKASELARHAFEPLAALLVENPHPLGAAMAPHLPDDAFVRGSVPMTKEEVRELVICKLRIRPSDIVWDVGAGTGSVSVEAARATFAGRVIAIERAPEACRLIERNKAAFGLTNLQVVAGEAPEVLGGLPSPDRVFVGGSSGRLEEILSLSLRANPALRLCVTAVTLETLMTVLSCAESLGLRDVDIAQVFVAKARTVGQSHLMEARNPVYLVSAGGPHAEADSFVREVGE